MYYKYGSKEIEYLKKKDKKLGRIIDNIGMVERPVDDNIFIAIIRAILGQQISREARETVYNRILSRIKDINPQNISRININELQSFGMTFRKAEYIRNFSLEIINGRLNLNELYELSDDKVIDKLSKIKGIGTWTAEMLLTSALQRPDIFSYGDLAIHRGLRMVYHHKVVTKAMFERYRKRYSPYGTVASIYLWEVSAGAIPEMVDFKLQKKVTK